MLDFGCGVGRICFLLAQNERVASVVGADVSEAMLEQLDAIRAQEDTTVQKKVSRILTSPHPHTQLAPMAVRYPQL